MSSYLHDRFFSVHLATNTGSATCTNVLLKPQGNVVAAPTSISGRPVTPSKPRARSFGEMAFSRIRKIFDWIKKQLPSAAPRATNLTKAKNPNSKIPYSNDALRIYLKDFFSIVANADSKGDAKKYAAARHNLLKIIGACHFLGINIADESFKDFVSKSYESLDAGVKAKARASLGKFLQNPMAKKNQDDAAVVFVKRIVEICLNNEAALISTVKDFPDVSCELNKALDDLGN
jgi:hypothetical protein